MGLDYFLFCEYLAGQVIVKGYFDYQGFLIAGAGNAVTNATAAKTT